MTEAAAKPSPDAFGALLAAAKGRRVCEHCQTEFAARRRWARFCSTACRKADYEKQLRLRIIREYLSELGKKGAAARKARKAAA